MGGAIPSNEQNDNNAGNKKLISTVSGALSGAVARFIVGPLDVVKIRFQVQLEPVAGTVQAGKYRGVIQCMREIVKEEGITALWRGTVPGQLLTIPYCAVQFLTIQHLKDTARRMGVMTGDLAPLVSFGSGAVAGVAATIASYPFDVLRTTLAAQGEPRVYRGMVDAAAGIVQKEGVRGLYKGLVPTLVEIVPYSAIQFGLYDAFNMAYNQARMSVSSPKDQQFGTADTKGQAFLQQFTCGFFSGLFSKLATHPLDVVKKRFQVAGLQRDLRYGKRVDSATVQRNFLRVLAEVYRTEGLRGLYKGALPSIIKAAPNAAVTFVTYEFFVGYLSASELFGEGKKANCKAPVGVDSSSGKKGNRMKGPDV